MSANLTCSTHATGWRSCLSCVQRWNVRAFFRREFQEEIQDKSPPRPGPLCAVSVQHRFVRRERSAVGVEQQLSAFDGVSNVRLGLVWDALWNPDRHARSRQTRTRFPLGTPASSRHSGAARHEKHSGILMKRVRKREPCTVAVSAFARASSDEPLAGLRAAVLAGSQRVPAGSAVAAGSVPSRLYGNRPGIPSFAGRYRARKSSRPSATRAAVTSAPSDASARTARSRGPGNAGGTSTPRRPRSARRRRVPRRVLRRAACGAADRPPAPVRSAPRASVPPVTGCPKSPPRRPARLAPDGFPPRANPETPRCARFVNGLQRLAPSPAPSV